VWALEDTANDVALSTASVWEIAIKRSLGKVTLPDGWAAALGRLRFDPMLRHWHDQQLLARLESPERRANRPR